MGLCRRVVFATIVFFAVCLFTSAFAGNKKMVDKRTVEMDDQNKQMVGQIPNLPKNGKVDAKARVINEGGSLVFGIYHVKTSVKEESIDFSGKEKSKDTKEELISNPEINNEFSVIKEEHQGAETKDLSKPEVQENNENLNIADEQKKEEISKELMSEPETDIEISDLNDKQQEIQSKDLSITNSECSESNDKNNINLNGGQPGGIVNDTVVSDIRVKDEAVKATATETQ